MRPNLAQGKENYTLKGEEFLQIYGSHVKSETLDSCIFETKMHQNAPNPISISIFPDPRHWGLCPIPPGREGMRGNGGKVEGKGRGWEVCIIAVGVIDAPGLLLYT